MTPYTEKADNCLSCYPERTECLQHLCGSSNHPRAKLGIILPSMLLQKRKSTETKWLWLCWVLSADHTISTAFLPQAVLTGWNLLPTHLGPIITEDPHNADRNSFVQTAPQSFAVKSKHEGNVLFTGIIDNAVQGVIQSTCPRIRKHGRNTGWKGFCYKQQYSPDTFFIPVSGLCQMLPGENRSLQYKYTIPLSHVEKFTQKTIP